MTRQTKREQFRQGLLAGMELSVNDWANQLAIKPGQVYNLLAWIRRVHKIAAHPVKKISGENVIVIIDRPHFKDKPHDRALLAEQVDARYMEEISTKLSGHLPSMERAVEVFPLLQPSVQSRLIGVAHIIISRQYEEIAKLMASYRTSGELLEAGSQTTTAGLGSEQR